MVLKKGLVIGCRNKRLDRLIRHPRHVRWPKFDVPNPNKVHQADFFFPHDPLDRWRGRKTYKYVLTVVDVASLKVAEPVTSKEAKEIAGAFQRNREFKIEERGRRQARPEVRITIWSSLRITKMSTLPRVGALLFSTDVIQRCSALLVKREYFEGLYSFFLSFFFHCLGVCRKCKVF